MPPNSHSEPIFAHADAVLIHPSRPTALPPVEAVLLATAFSKFLAASARLEESYRAPICEFEKGHLENSLAMTHGNRSRAAQVPGINLRIVLKRIFEYGLPPRRYA
jgi:DNA-binding protein Fis